MDDELIIDDVELENRLYVDDSKIHGLGVFARKKLPSKQYLGSYHGPTTQENDTYVLWVEDEHGEWFGIDGQNLLRYLNHSATPNTEFDGDELYTLQNINKDEEITFDYGEEFRAQLEADES